MGSTLPPGLLNPHLVTAPEAFGYKTAWFAVRSEDINAVAKAIELESPEQVNWQYGVWHAYQYNDYQVFVTPPVKGWVLTVGMPILWEVVNHAHERMVGLSKQFGETQLFASVRTSSCYLWTADLSPVGRREKSGCEFGIVFSGRDAAGHWSRKQAAARERERHLQYLPSRSPTLRRLATA